MRRGSWGVRVRRADRAIAAVLAVLTVSGPAAQAAPRPDPAPSTSKQARREAGAAAVKVAELTREYRRRERLAARSAQELAAAFRLVALAEDAQREAEDELHRARARQSARVRALYMDGEAGIALSALAASSPSEAVWRVTVGRRIGAGVVRVGVTEVAQLRRAHELAVRRETATGRAGERMSAALARFGEESEASARLLARARHHLDTLSAQAERLEAAEKAAAELAAAEAAAAGARLSSGSSGTALSALSIPAGYERSYRAAAGRCPGLRWTLLAALGQVESGHGRNNGPSSAGAVGPMQFMPATFASYGVDGDGDGVADPWNPADAVHSAANYLCASGLDASVTGVRTALFAYNRAQWYVDLVLATELAIIDRAAP